MELKRRLSDGEATLGETIVSRVQTSGRGRGDNQWHSPPGGLYFSILLKTRAHRPPTDLGFLGGVALAQCVHHFGNPVGEMALKWPNDLLIAGHKVAGILAELEGKDQILLGIGLNLTTPTKTLSEIPAKFPARSLSQFLSTPIALDDFALTLQRKLHILFSEYEIKGFEPIRQAWLQHCPWVGRRLQIATGASHRNETSGEGAASTWWGTMVGIDDEGALVLRDEANREQVLISAEILCCLP